MVPEAAPGRTGGSERCRVPPYLKDGVRSRGQTPPRAPPTPPPPAPGTPGCMRRGRWGAASGGWWWGAVLPPAVEGGVSILEVKGKAPRELSRPMEGSAERGARFWSTSGVGGPGKGSLTSKTCTAIDSAACWDPEIPEGRRPAGAADLGPGRDGAAPRPTPASRGR